MNVLILKLLYKKSIIPLKSCQRGESLPQLKKLMRTNSRGATPLCFSLCRITSFKAFFMLLKVDVPQLRILCCFGCWFTYCHYQE